METPVTHLSPAIFPRQTATMAPDYLFERLAQGDHRRCAADCSQGVFQQLREIHLLFVIWVWINTY